MSAPARVQSAGESGWRALSCSSWVRARCREAQLRRRAGTSKSARRQPTTATAADHSRCSVCLGDLQLWPPGSHEQSCEQQLVAKPLQRIVRDSQGGDR